MKRQFILPLLFVLVCACSATSARAQVSSDDSKEESKTNKVLKASGKAASEVGKATINAGAESAKVVGNKVVVPTAKLMWDPVLKKGAPKVIGEGAKLAGKGIKNGFKLIFKRDKESQPVVIRQTT